MIEETNETIIGRVRGGDREAFAGLVDRYRGMVYGLAFHRLGSAEDARDVAQEAFVIAFRRLDQLRDPAKFAPWLRQVTTNACRAWQRRERPTQELPELAARDKASAQIETRIVVEAALACLSPQTRQTVTLFYVHEHTLAEIAAFLDVPVTTIKSRLRDARARLRKELREMNEETKLPEPLPADFTARVIRRLQASNAVFSLAFSPDGCFLVNETYRCDSNNQLTGDVQVWEVATGALRATLPANSWVEGTAWSRGGNEIAFGCGVTPDPAVWRSEVRVWEWETNAVRTLVQLADGVVKSVSFSPKENLLATGSGHRDAGGQHWGEVRLWDPDNGALLWSARHLDQVWAITFSPDGTLLATGSGQLNADKNLGVWSGGEVRLWNAQTGVPGHVLPRPHARAQSEVAFSPDGTLLATGDGPEGDVLVWSVQNSAAPPRRLQGHTREVYAVAFSPDGFLLASGSGDATVRLWDVATGELRATLSGHDISVQGVAFSPDGQTLASADIGPHYYPDEAAKNQGSVRLWRVK